MADEKSLRTTFNQVASNYDIARPGYPDALFDEVTSRSSSQAGGLALEIGCGTGQATLPFAQRGWRIHCLDIGADMLKIAAQNLSAYRNVSFELTAFEDWTAQPATFDLLYAATAFHWVPDYIRYSKTALVLRPGGWMAEFSNQHPRPYTGFFVEVQPIYERIPEMVGKSDPLPTSVEISRHTEEIERTGLFQKVEVLTYPWVKTYTTAEYLRLLMSYSGHIALDEDRRQALLQAIADLIDTRYQGQVERPYLTVLYLGKK
jgi:ubiquinone/menaquinone biosynthesis C-methylase UbiE